MGFIGVKLLFHALHENNLPFVNGGENVGGIPEIPTLMSLLVIVGVLAVTVAASVLKSKRDEAQGGISISHNHYDWDEEGNKIVRTKSGEFVGKAADLPQSELP